MKCHDFYPINPKTHGNQEHWVIMLCLTTYTLIIYAFLAFESFPAIFQASTQRVVSPNNRRGVALARGINALKTHST